MADIQYMRSKESFAASFLLDRFNIRILLRNTPDLLTEINIRCKQCLVIFSRISHKYVHKYNLMSILLQCFIYHLSCDQ